MIEDGNAELISHYDLENAACLSTPFAPRSSGEIAVLLTRNIMGIGEEVCSRVFGHPSRKKPMSHNLNLLREPRTRSSPLNEVAFGWTYTTGSLFEPMKALREGLYGHSPIQLAEYSQAVSRKFEIPRYSMTNQTRLVAFRPFLHSSSRFFYSNLNDYWRFRIMMRSISPLITSTTWFLAGTPQTYG